MPPYDPSQAVDGDTSTVMGSDGLYRMFQSGDGDSQPWLCVDLGETFLVDRIVLVNRLDCCGESLANAEVRVGMVSITSVADTEHIADNVLVWRLEGSGQTAEVYDIPLEQATAGRWVTLQNFEPSGT